MSLALNVRASGLLSPKYAEWAQKEIKGYEKDEVLPDYRVVRSVNLIYNGINGNYQVKNSPLSINIIPKDLIDSISSISIHDGIKYVEELANSKDDSWRDVTMYANNVFAASGGIVKCTSIKQMITHSSFQTICSIVRDKVINELIEMENQYGILDGLEIQTDYDSENTFYWSNIHPRIIKVSKSLFQSDFFDSAAEKAIREVETCMREMFGKLKPESPEPKGINDIVGALLSENGLYKYCDTTTTDGKNFCRGFKALCEGAFSAYRNPASHKNIPVCRREAFERIVLASAIMYILEPN